MPGLMVIVPGEGAGDIRFFLLLGLHLCVTRFCADISALIRRCWNHGNFLTDVPQPGTWQIVQVTVFKAAAPARKVFEHKSCCGTTVRLSQEALPSLEAVLRQGK